MGNTAAAGAGCDLDSSWAAEGALAYWIRSGAAAGLGLGTKAGCLSASFGGRNSIFTSVSTIPIASSGLHEATSTSKTEDPYSTRMVSPLVRQAYELNTFSSLPKL